MFRLINDLPTPPLRFITTWIFATPRTSVRFTAPMSGYFGSGQSVRQPRLYLVWPSDLLHPVHPDGPEALPRA